MDQKALELLKRSKEFAFLYECIAPLYVVLCQPLSEEGQKSANKIWNDADRAKEFRKEVDQWLESHPS